MCMCSAEDESTRTLAQDPGWAGSNSGRQARHDDDCQHLHDPLESDCKE